MYGHERAIDARSAVSAAYLLEAAGSAIGGVVASLVLLRFLSPFQIACIVLLLNLCMAAFLLFQLSRRQLGFVAAVAALLGIFLFVCVAPWLEGAAQARQWRGFHLLASRDSIYGNLTVVETGNIRSLYENGLILANSPDESAAEESVHYALLEHPAPHRILMIGGGASGAIAQALRHPTVERIDLVELDPALIGVAREFFPSEAAPPYSDSRVHLHYADGRAYLKSARDNFDVIIVNVPDPQTAQLNRFYTAEFFRSARNHLAPGGLLALQLRSAEEAISPGLAEFLRCIDHTLHGVFPYVVAIPGETIHFFAAMRSDVLTDDPHLLVSRLLERNLKTRYVREYFIPFRMMPDRMEQVRDQLQPLATTAVNRDFSPIAYYFDVELWSAQFKPAYAAWLRTAAHLDFKIVLGAVLVVLFLAAALLGFTPASRTARPRGCRQLHGRDGIHVDGVGDFSAACISIHLRLRLPPARHFDRALHGRHRCWKLACRAPHSPRRPLRQTLHRIHAVSSHFVSARADAAGQPAREGFRHDGNLDRRSVRLSRVGRALRYPGRLPVSHGDPTL
jgi:spermidine synthase